MAPLKPDRERELERAWHTLVRLALFKRLPEQDAEDLASAALFKALTQYREDRGTLLAFSKTVLFNEIKNYWRDRKVTEPIDEDGHESGEQGIEEDLEEEERREAMKRLLERLKARLSPEELSFLTALGEVLKERDSRAVSEASRRAGLDELKGWDLFRCIQRKARALKAPPSARAPRAADLEIDARVLEGFENVLIGKRLPPAVPPREGARGTSEEDVFSLALLLERQKAFHRFLGQIS